ncbi:MAG: hypothetical protein EA418_00290 [Wenzhouxiangellaceae bacterium]|nr:MAG: hypothetical protein EA418_00290 [Wenzhouxiangellaceae bacterium]
MFLRFLSALALTFTLGVATAAADSRSQTEGGVQSPEDFLSSIAELRVSFQDGEPRPLSRREWREFDRIESRFQRLLANVDDVSKLHDDRKIELHNLQEEFNALLVEGTHDDRLVCTRTRRTGSRIPQRDCMTQRELELERQRTRASLDAVAPYWGSPPRSAPNDL